VEDVAVEEESLIKVNDNMRPGDQVCILIVCSLPSVLLLALPTQPHPEALTGLVVGYTIPPPSTLSGMR